MDTISKIETFDARVPLAAPLAVGSASITHRTYCLVRITTSDGIVGIGYSYSRGLPIAKIIDDVIAPLAIGNTAEDPDQIRKQILAFNWQSAEHGTFTAAVSAVDVALHDVLGKRTNKSIASLFGSTKVSVPIYSVVGYHYGDDESGLIEEINVAKTRGIKSFKIVIGAKSPERDALRLAVLRKEIGEKAEIAVDAFRTLKTLENAVTRVNLIKEYGISFVEDPFLESEGPLAIELREATGVPVSFGESLASSKMCAQVLHYNQTDVLRLDALVVGGVSEFFTAAKAAEKYGKTIATHIHTELHSQLVATIPNLYSGGMEYLDPVYEIDLFHHLLVNPIQIVDGCAVLSQSPGFGFEWDWDAIHHYSK